jgi:hypothetical protein
MSGSHFIVYGARHGAKSFFEGISDPTFFMSINRILDESFYREYFDPRLEKIFSFPGLLEFVTDREGLDIADWVPFMKALRAQDNGTAAKVLYWRMVGLDERLNPLVGLASELGPRPEAGLANPSGKKKDCLGYRDNVGQRGTSEEYVVRRLKRDAPELATALARGEFPSARAAGIAAGFIKPSPPSLQLKDPAPTARKLLEKQGSDWCLQLMEELSELVL